MTIFGGVHDEIEVDNQQEVFWSIALWWVSPGWSTCIGKLWTCLNENNFNLLIPAQNKIVKRWRRLKIACPVIRILLAVTCNECPSGSTVNSQTLKGLCTCTFGTSTRRHANSELCTPLTAGSDKNTQRNATGIRTRVCMYSGAPTHNPASCQFFLFFGENRDYLVRNDPEKPGRAF